MRSDLPGSQLVNEVVLKIPLLHSMNTHISSQQKKKNFEAEGNTQQIWSILLRQIEFYRTFLLLWLIPCLLPVVLLAPSTAVHHRTFSFHPHTNTHTMAPQTLTLTSWQT